MYTSLCISNNSVRILAVKGKRIYRWGSIALPEGLVRDGLIAQPEAVAELINSLFKSLKIPKEKVSVSISGLSFTYRFLNLPKLKPNVVEEAIRRGAKKDISIPLDELYLSWQSLPEQKEEQLYFLLGVSRYLVDSLTQTLEAAHIEPYLMDIQPLALARAANINKGIIVSLEPESYDIIIVADCIPTVIHTITPRDKEGLLEDNINRLVNELTKTVAFFQSNYPYSNLDNTTPLLLTGELAEMGETLELLHSMTEYPIELLEPAMDHPPDLQTALYSANIGLVLKRLPVKKSLREERVYYHDVNINLLEEKYQKAKPPQTSTKYILIGAIVAIAIIFLYPLYQSNNRLEADNSFLEDRQFRIEREMNLATLMNQEAVATENITQELSTHLTEIQGIHRELLGFQGNYIDRYKEIIGNLPESLYVTSVDMNKNMIIIEGETENVFSVVKYTNQLGDISIFNDIRIAELDEGFVVQDDMNDDETEQTYERFITFKIVITK